jgi:hypothetical protein
MISKIWSLQFNVGYKGAVNQRFRDGLDPEVSPNHSWRHIFKRRAARAGIEPRIRDAMCGHAPKVVGDEYETPETADLIEAMKKFPRYEVAPTIGT